MAERGGCYVMYKLGEGNFRVVVVSLVMLSYALAGAGIFQAIEMNHEKDCRENYLNIFDTFLKKHPHVNQTELKELLSTYATAAMKGHLVSNSERWDYMGALYYVVTLLTTIGFGMTTPGTDAGKITTIIYGFFGCSLNVLCMNLLLERHIIFFTKIMRIVNDMFRKLKSKIAPNVVEMESGIKSIEEWKPPIAKLLLALLVTMLIIILAMAGAHSSIENWTYLDSVYYCFVTYTTIGFGDFVAQQQYTRANIFYSILNGISIYFGMTIMYSVYNVQSILLKDIVVKFSSWITISCYKCYYDPNIDKAAVRGRRTHAVPMSAKSNGFEFTSQRLNITSTSRTHSANLSLKQYENNIANITQEFRANHCGSSFVSCSSNPDLRIYPSADTPATNINANVPPMTINSPTEQARASIHSLGVDISSHKHTFLRIESFKASDHRHLSLARRESDLVLAARLDRPKSRIQREAGGMNAVRSALEKVTAEVSADVSDNDEY